MSFDDLLQRIHPAASRIKKLSVETPATLLVFDILVDGAGHNLTEKPLTSAAKLSSPLPISSSRVKRGFGFLPEPTVSMLQRAGFTGWLARSMA